MITKNVPRINSLVLFKMRAVIFTPKERREEGKTDEREEKENSKIQREQTVLRSRRGEKQAQGSGYVR